MLNNQPLTRLRPLTAAKWWGASGSATGKTYFQGNYSVELEKGRWLAKHNETTRLPNATTDFATKEEAMRMCGIYQDCAILRAKKTVEMRIDRRKGRRQQPTA
jgi:hypothetical protein